MTAAGAALLGVDLGARRVGVAMSDPSGTYALPLQTIEVRSSEEARDRVLESARERSARTIVLGHARDMSGRVGAKARECEAFAEALRTAGLHVVLWDERLSSVQAERNLRQAAFDRRARKERVDRVAAQIILQSYLDAHPPTAP